MIVLEDGSEVDFACDRGKLKMFARSSMAPASSRVELTPEEAEALAKLILAETKKAKAHG